MATSQSEVRVGSRFRAWPLFAEPSALLALMLVTDLVAVAWTVGSFAVAPPSWQTVALVLFLAVTAVAFEEGVARATRLQLRLSSDLKRDMTSVWAVAAAVALAGAPAAMLLALIFTYTWFRQHRPAGRPRHRVIFNATTMIVSAFTASNVVSASESAWSGLPSVLPNALSIVAVMVVFTLANRVIVTLSLVSLGARGMALLGSKDDNLLEFATLCLGGLVALAIEHEPLLTLLVVAPMVGLHRGSLMRELEQFAMTDSKTGLLNAVAWEQLAQRELARAEREKYPLAILIVDIDRFKGVNDRFGHLVGDQVLHAMGRCLAGALREYDGLGRFGGEEFVAVLPEANAADALAVAERIRARTNELLVHEIVGAPVDGAEARLSVSVGVAVTPTDGGELAELLHAADQALYQAKSGGRNQVRLADRGDGRSETLTV